MAAGHDDPIAVETWRGGRVESVSHAHAVLADTDGAIVRSWGDATRAIYPRSAIKAFQALPLVESGAADAFGFSEAMLALACASHSGTARHADTARAMLEACGASPADLACGVHAPMGKAARAALREDGDGPTALHNNCSGKHAGMIAYARHVGHEVEGYWRRDHPVQRDVSAALASFIGTPHPPEAAAVDGCSLPNHPAPLDALAAAFARFGTGTRMEPGRARTCARLRDACLAEPEMVAGAERCCTRVMKALAGAAFVKVGAEGVYVAALPRLGLGLCLKVEDGGREAAEAALCAILKAQLDPPADAAAVLDAYAARTIVNWNGIRTGEVRVQGVAPA